MSGNRLPRVALAARRRLAAIVAAGLISSVSIFVAQPVAATGPKVVIVVGPSGSSTARYIDLANNIARQAASYGATVVRIYTPNATWSRVKSAAQGAKVFVYLGHGNGWPSPYGPFQTYTKDGLGLNPVAGHGTTTPVKYIGEAYIASQIRFAPGAVVLLNHLCYASGNGEPGSREPSWTVARQRVDNYAAGFIGAGARAVIADGHSDLSHELAMILGPGSRNLAIAWKTDSETRHHTRSFGSVRRSGYTMYIDPDRTGSGFYRSLITKTTFVTGAGGTIPTPTPTPTPVPVPTPTPDPTSTPTPIPDGSLVGTLTSDAYLHPDPSRDSPILATIRAGTRLTVSGPFVADGSGHAWTPVTTSAGQAGYVTAIRAEYAGRSEPTSPTILFGWPDPTARIVATLPADEVVSVIGSRAVSETLWLNVRTSTGASGWVRALGMRP